MHPRLASTSLILVLVPAALTGCILQQQQQRQSGGGGEAAGGGEVGSSASGLYFGLGLGLSMVDSSTGEDSNYTVDETDVSYGGTIGYRMHRYFGVEGGYLNLGKEEYDLDAGLDDGDVETDGFHVSAIGHYPIYGMFEGLARVGAFRWESTEENTFDSGGGPVTDTSTDDGVDAYFGLGVEARFAPHWSARLEWARLNADNNFDNFSIGAFYSL